MTENQFPDPFGEAVGQAGREVKTMAYVTALFIGAYLRHQAQAEQKMVLRDEQAKRAAAARERAERDAVRARWAPALDRRWLRGANAVELADTWVAAVPYADPASDLYERSAELAADNCEARLNDLHPYAMNHYHRLRADGLSRPEAMKESLPLFLNHPHAQPQDSSPRLSLTAQGLDHRPPDQAYGPDRAGFDQHVTRQQTARGQRIVGQMQSRALSSDRPLLSTDEQRTALINATNLPPAVIGQIVPSGPAPSRPSRRPWENESPFSIEEVVAFAASHPDSLASPASGPDPKRTRTPDRARHA